MKNRAPAPIQITAEQLLREAKERQLEDAPRAPKQYITDREELQEYRQNKRKDFENQIRRQRHHIGTWWKYAVWEASQKEFERSRSVFERALDVDYRNQTIWLKYAEMEMKNKFINHARNIWDRAVSLHPRVDTFWYKYSYMEEIVGAVENARQVFERWMKWEPDDMGWAAYIKFEMRQGEIARARGIYERYINNHPTCRAYLKYAKWEEKMHQKLLSRQIYERATEELHPSERSEKLLINFARFEERCKEFERARVIFKYALSQFNKEDSPELYQEFIAFEKRHGTRDSIEEAIINKRRQHYQDQINSDKYNYDIWFDFLRLEQDEGDINAIRMVYDQAVANIPPVADKRFWRRYMYLWIYYAVFEELQAGDVTRAREVYQRCLKIIPHKKFTFGKIWMMAAELEVRQKDLPAARKILGQGIGLCGKESIFKGYIELELQLGEVERCRSIYIKYLETMPFNCHAWKAFATLETNVGETTRARAVYELAVSQPELDMPEVLWKAYIDFEIAESLGVRKGRADEGTAETTTEYQEALERIRALFERLLSKTSHVKVWISFGQFEASTLGEGEETCPDDVASDVLAKMRDVFTRGYNLLKSQDLKEERLILLQAWRDAEAKAGSHGKPEDVDARMPRKIKMKRLITSEDGGDGNGWEEYYDYSFPDDEKAIVGIKILENAMKWKQLMANAGAVAPVKDSGDQDEESEATSNGVGVLGKRKASEEIDIDEDEDGKEDN